MKNTQSNRRSFFKRALGTGSMLLLAGAMMTGLMGCETTGKCADCAAGTKCAKCEAKASANACPDCTADKMCAKCEAKKS